MSYQQDQNGSIPIALSMPQTDNSMALEGNNFQEPPTPTTRAETISRMELEDLNITEEPMSRRERYFFQDKVIVDGETLFEISGDKVFHEEEKHRRSTRWTDPVTRKSKFLFSTDLAMLFGLIFRG